MDPRLLEYYNRELHYLRAMGSEFSEQYPKVAARLGMRGIEIEDPYVERLLEGFALLAARIHLKYDAEFPRFSQRLLEVVYPGYLAPTPAMCVVQMHLPDDKAAVAAGFDLKRGSVMRSRVPAGERTACEFRTGAAMTLWPLQLRTAKVRGGTGTRTADGRAVRSSLALTLDVTAPLDLGKRDFGPLTFYIKAPDELASRLYEKVFSSTVGLRVTAFGQHGEVSISLGREYLRGEGFDDDQALLPVAAAGFGAYRLLHEYLTFPSRFWFFSICGLDIFLKSSAPTSFTVSLLFDSDAAEFEPVVEVGNFALHCVPVVNLCDRRTDRIEVAGNRLEYHVIPDRARPTDFEIYSVRSVEGYSANNTLATEFRPLFSSIASDGATHHGAFFSVRRELRRMSEHARRNGTRTAYIGSEVFLSLVDATEAPFRADIQQLGLEVTVTNRDLPLLMPIGGGASDFTLVSSAAVAKIEVLRGPTRPSPSFAERELAWRLISHLSINYLSLADQDAGALPQTLRRLLELYGAAADDVARRQIEGIRVSKAEAIHARLPGPGPLVFGRGTGVEVTVDEQGMSGSSPFLLGAVLEHFLARHASINSFVQLTLRSAGARGVIHRWPVRTGRRPTA